MLGLAFLGGTEVTEARGRPVSVPQHSPRETHSDRAKVTPEALGSQTLGEAGEPVSAQRCQVCLKESWVW